MAELAEELGVCWWTVMGAVIGHGTPLVDDQARVGPVAKLGVDETSWLAANRGPSTPPLVDLDGRIVIDMFKGNPAPDLRRWLQAQPPAWLAGITTVTTDLAESYRARLASHLKHAVRVADPFHVVRVANRCLDKVRRRVQNETLGHRGRRPDPRYRIRKLLLAPHERLDEGGPERMLLGLRVGDPHDEGGRRVAGQGIGPRRLSHRRSRRRRHPVDKAIAGCIEDDVAEIQALGRTLGAWRSEILAHHTTGASNEPTEALNLCVKRVKRCGHGFRQFEHYRLRVLLHTGGVT